MLIFSPVTKAHNNVVVVPLSGSEDKAPKTEYLAISANTFIGDDIIRHTGFGEAYLRTGVSQAWVETPVHLPNDSVVSEFQCHMRDTDASGRIEVRLVRHSSYKTEETMAQVGDTTNTYAAGSKISTDTAISNATIDNANYAYYIVMYITGIQNTGNLALNRCRLTYI